jgi:hypothetical protein
VLASCRGATEMRAREVSASSMQVRPGPPGVAPASAPEAWALAPAASATTLPRRALGPGDYLGPPGAAAGAVTVSPGPRRAASESVWSRPAGPCGALLNTPGPVGPPPRRGELNSTRPHRHKPLGLCRGQKLKLNHDRPRSSSLILTSSTVTVLVACPLSLVGSPLDSAQGLRPGPLGCAAFETETESPA